MLSMFVTYVQGLWGHVQERMDQWRFAAPCRVSLVRSSFIVLQNVPQGLDNALQQLSALPNIAQVRNKSSSCLYR